jgi:hypothetical protein
MTYDRRRARQLSTQSEFELISASYSDAIGKLPKRALKSNIARARRLRDKQRDLLRRQRLASRARSGSKHGRRPDSNMRTAQKAELFEETLSRFTRGLEALEAAERRKASQPAPSKRRAAPGKGPTPRGRAAGKARGGGTLRQKARSPRMKAIQAHVGSRARRAQARRDSR